MISTEKAKLLTGISATLMFLRDNIGTLKSYTLFKNTARQQMMLDKAISQTIGTLIMFESAANADLDTFEKASKNMFGKNDKGEFEETNNALSELKDYSDIIDKLIGSLCYLPPRVRIFVHLEIQRIFQRVKEQPNKMQLLEDIKREHEEILKHKPSTSYESFKLGYIAALTRPL